MDTVIRLLGHKTGGSHTPTGTKTRRKSYACWDIRQGYSHTPRGGVSGTSSDIRHGGGGGGGGGVTLGHKTRGKVTHPLEHKTRGGGGG